MEKKTPRRRAVAAEAKKVLGVFQCEAGQRIIKLTLEPTDRERENSASDKFPRENKNSSEKLRAYAVYSDLHLLLLRAFRKYFMERRVHAIQRDQCCATSICYNFIR